MKKHPFAVFMNFIQENQNNKQKVDKKGIKLIKCDSEGTFNTRLQEIPSIFSTLIQPNYGVNGIISSIPQSFKIHILFLESTHKSL